MSSTKKKRREKVLRYVCKHGNASIALAYRMFLDELDGKGREELTETIKTMSDFIGVTGPTMNKARAFLVKHELLSIKCDLTGNPNRVLTYALNQKGEDQIIRDIVNRGGE